MKATSTTTIPLRRKSTLARQTAPSSTAKRTNFTTAKQNENSLSQFYDYNKPTAAKPKPVQIPKASLPATLNNKKRSTLCSTVKRGSTFHSNNTSMEMRGPSYSKKST